MIAPHVHHWIETLSKALENLDAANEVVFQFTQMLVGTALHATNLGDKKTVSNQERKTRNSCKHLRSALFFIRKAETDKSSSFEFGIWHKLNPKLPDLARFHPTVLPVMSPKWEDWKQTVIKERNNKRLVWLSQIRSFTPRSAKWTVDPQAAIKSVLRGSEDNEISSIICGETNTFTTEPNQIAHVVREHFKSKIGISGLPEPHPVPRWVTDEELRQSHLDGQYNDLISPLTQNEILDQLKKTEKTTAPGPDRLAPLLLKIAIVNAPPDDDSALTLTTAIANAVFVTRGALDVCKHSIGKALWKKQNNKRSENLRPIALQNTLSKLPAKVLANRLSKIFHDKKILHSANEGFIKEGSTSNAIHTLLDIWEDAKQRKQACFNLQIDITGAYDNLPWYAIERAMRRLHLPLEFQEFCMKRMENCFIKFRTAYGYSEPLQIKRGVPQGDPLSCLLFVICLDHLHSGMEANPICWERHNLTPYNDGYILSFTLCPSPHNRKQRICR